MAAGSRESELTSQLQAEVAHGLKFSKPHLSKLLPLAGPHLLTCPDSCLSVGWGWWGVSGGCWECLIQTTEDDFITLLRIMHGLIRFLKRTYSVLFYVCLFACTHVCALCVCLVLEEDTRFTGKGVTNGCKLPWVLRLEPRSSVSALSQDATSSASSSRLRSHVLFV